MQRVRTVVALLLAVFWLPITMHCQLESLPGVDFLAHCMHPQNSPHHDNDCDEDRCAVVESGLYTSALQRLEISAPVLGPCAFFCTIPDCEELVNRPGLAMARRLPPDTPLPWHFAFRAALPARAPSRIA